MIAVPALLGALAVPALLLVTWLLLRLVVPWWERARDVAPAAIAQVVDGADDRALLGAIAACARRGRILAFGDTAVIVLRGRLNGEQGDRCAAALRGVLRPAVGPIVASPRPRRRVGTCDRPPAGWTCSLDAGHDGPCPASPAAGGDE